MKSFKILAAAALISAVGFSGTAFAEGEYQYVDGPSFASNAVGGGRIMVVNTGNSDNPLSVVYLSHDGEQRPVGGRVATISTQDMGQPVYVSPVQAPVVNPLAALRGLFDTIFSG